MRPLADVALLGTLLLLASAGCNGNARLWPSQSSVWNQQQVSPQVAQLEDLNRRASELDANNRDLHSQSALAIQQVQLLRDELATVRKQLSDTASQLQVAQLENAEANKKMQTLQASLRHRGSATITANSSLKQPVPTVELPGLEMRQDGDVVRIALPADQLFTNGTANLSPTATSLLDRVADAIQRHYPRQVIGVEGYTDNSPTSGTYVSSHQLASAQASAVLDQLIRRNRLPVNQLFMVSHGANHPLASNATPVGKARNRRVEVVVYPETMDRS